MDTQNNIEQAIDEKVTELTELIQKIGGYAIVMASHQDIRRVRSSLLGPRLHLINLVISFAKGDKDFLNILKIALDLMEDDQTTKAGVPPTTTLPS